jgi:hypothetical protein
MLRAPSEQKKKKGVTRVAPSEQKKKKGVTRVAQVTTSQRNPAHKGGGKVLCRTRMEGTHSTDRTEPNITSICRGDCLEGGDHGQCSTPEKHATQTGGLPPVRNRTHTPNSPGQHTSEHSVEAWLKLCCNTHPQDRCLACRSGTFCIPGCPKSAHPNICTAAS